MRSHQNTVEQVRTELNNKPECCRNRTEFRGLDSEVSSQ